VSFLAGNKKAELNGTVQVRSGSNAPEIVNRVLKSGRP
jgi:hypothetical protein